MRKGKYFFKINKMFKDSLLGDYFASIGILYYALLEIMESASSFLYC